jgi:hypothetical protein
MNRESGYCVADLLGDRFVDVEAADKTPSSFPEQVDRIKEVRYWAESVII